MFLEYTSGDDGRGVNVATFNKFVGLIQEIDEDLGFDQRLLVEKVSAFAIFIRGDQRRLKVKKYNMIGACYI